MWRRGATGDRGAAFAGVRQRSFAASDGGPRRPHADDPLVDGPSKGAFRVFQEEAHPLFAALCCNACRVGQDAVVLSVERKDLTVSCMVDGPQSAARESGAGSARLFLRSRWSHLLRGSRRRFAQGHAERSMRNGAWAFRCFRRDCSATSPARAPASTWAVASRWAVNLGDAGGSRRGLEECRPEFGGIGSDAGEQVDSDDRRLYGNSPRRNRGLYSEFAQHPAQFVR